MAKKRREKEHESHPYAAPYAGAAGTQPDPMASPEGKRQPRGGRGAASQKRNTPDLQ